MAKQSIGSFRAIADFLEIEDSNASAGQEKSSLRHVVDKVTTYDTTGTADGQFNRIYSLAATVTSGSPTSIDLSGTLLSKLDSSSVQMAEICGLYVENRSTSGNLLLGAGSNAISTIWGATAQVIIQPSGSMFIDCGSLGSGYVVTAATADILQVAASAGTVSYRLLVIGRNA